MTIQRMEHVGIVVDDLAAATAFFVELGLKLQGEGPVEGGWVDRVVGLEQDPVIDMGLRQLPPAGRSGTQSDQPRPRKPVGARFVALAAAQLGRAPLSRRGSSPR